MCTPYNSNASIWDQHLPLTVNVLDAFIRIIIAIANRQYLYIIIFINKYDSYVNKLNIYYF
jgi:hypothetical protein